MALSLVIHSCRSVKQTEEFNHVGTEQVAIDDTSCTIERDTFWSESLDTSVAEVFRTIVIFDTERTDTNGMHPVKQIEQVQSIKHTAKVSKQTDTHIRSEESARTETAEVADSTKTSSVRVASRPWYSLIGSIVWSIVGIVIILYAGKKFSNYLDGKV